MLHKLSADHVRNYDLIAFEDLVPSNMVKDYKLVKAIQDASWSEFRRQLVYKAARHGKMVVTIDSSPPVSYARPAMFSGLVQRIFLCESGPARYAVLPTTGTLTQHRIF